MIAVTPGVAAHHLVQTPSRRVPGIGRPDIGLEQGADGRQFGGEGAGDLPGPPREVGGPIQRRQLEFEAHLLFERRKARRERLLDEGVEVQVGGARRTEMAREEGRHQAVHDLDGRPAGGQFGRLPAAVAGLVRLHPEVAQRLDDPVEVRVGRRSHRIETGRR
ncbi:MAG: hypothetical protein WDN45_15555 [Caulobacteraceae bacterium]